MKKASIGIDIGGTSIKLGLVDDRGKILLRDQFLTPKESGRKALIDKLASHVSVLAAEALKRKLTLCGVGIGAPGPIDVERGIVYFFPNIPGWKNTPFKKILEKKLRLSVFIDNDANAMALGEYCFGGGQGARSMVALTLGTGLGGGMVLDGKLFHGPHFSAAEFGHVIVDENGPACGCGNRGCIETFVGNGYFVKELQAELGKGKKSLLRKWLKEGQQLSPKLAQDAAWAGDALSREQWRKTGERLGTFLAGIANVLNPDRIVVGGGLSLSGDLLFKPLREAFKKKAFPIATRFVKVVPAVLGSDAGLVGAAALALPHESKAKKNG